MSRSRVHDLGSPAPSSVDNSNHDGQPDRPSQRLKQILGIVKGNSPRVVSRPANALHELYPKSNIQLPNHHIDDVRSLKVIVIGAGLSGILAGILLPVKVPKIQLTILEKNDEVVSNLQTWATSSC